MANRVHQELDHRAAAPCTAQPGSAPERGGAITQKIRRHLLPLLFVLYVVAYLDRINVGFAALTMNRELGLTSQQYGLLSGVFFWGYFLFEVPSNLLLERIGARIWIARILITWGVVSLATGFAQSAMQLYVARFLLGVAEAGFFPGILFYLTGWFRQKDLPHTIGLFMTALPVASILGAPISGWILEHCHAFGLGGWRWLLIIEALPAILGGLLTFTMLPDGPGDATFLTAEHKASLAAALEVEAKAKPRLTRSSVLGTVWSPRVLHLSAVAFLFLVGLYAAGFWMPQSIKAVGRGLDHVSIGLLVMIPNVIGLFAMVLVSRSSSRRSERHWHAALSLLIGALAFYFVGSAATVAACVALWSVAAVGLYGFVGPFWSLPGQFLSGRAAAAALASICSIGNLGGFFGLSAIGSLATRTGDLAAGFRLVAAALLVGSVLLMAQRWRETVSAAPKPIHGRC